jgi:hypothetical protein
MSDRLVQISALSRERQHRVGDDHHLLAVVHIDRGGERAQRIGAGPDVRARDALP